MKNCLKNLLNNSGSSLVNTMDAAVFRNHMNQCLQTRLVKLVGSYIIIKSVNFTA